MPRKARGDPKQALFSITAARENEKVMNMVKYSWKKRFQKLREHVVQMAAQAVLDGVKEKLPSSGDYKEYIDSLSLAQIDGLPVGLTGYAIQGKSKKKSGRSLDTEKTLVYVRIRRRPRRVSSQVQTLAEHSPWTLESLPFVPKPSDAQVIYRKASAKAVLLVAKQRRKDKKVWSKALSRGGVRVQGQKDKLRLGNGRIKGVQDLAYTALNIELGQGGVKAKPHWRPAFSGLQRRTVPNMSKGSEFNRAVSDPDFRTWMSWPKKTGKHISAKVAQSFVPFQKKLGIKW